MRSARTHSSALRAATAEGAAVERPRLAAVAGAAIRLVPSAVGRLWQRVCSRREVEQHTRTSSYMELEDAVRLGAVGSDAEQRGAVHTTSS